MNRILMIPFVISCILLGACNSRDTKDIACPSDTYIHQNGMPTENLFELDLQNDTSNIYVGDEISVIVRNISDHSIWFPADLNLFMVLRYSEYDFYVVEDQSTREDNNFIILGSAGSGADEHQYFILPRLTDLESETKVYIEVSGNIYEGGKICDTLYNSYLDVEILPKQ